MYTSLSKREKKKIIREKLSTLHILYATKVICQAVRVCVCVCLFHQRRQTFFLTTKTLLAVECVEIDEWIGMEN